MMPRFAYFGVAAACAIASGVTCAQVKNFPNRPVRIIVPVPPGGIVDVVVRLLGQKMTEVMGQGVVIDNRAGASTNIGTEMVARATGDGYTLLANSLPLVVNPSMFAKLPFDVEKDFAPVSLVAGAPYAIVVHPSVPARSIKELVALARAKPALLNYSSAGNGSNLHVAAELFKNMSGANIVHVPYKGGGPALTAIVGGECDLSFLSLVAVLPQINARRVNALAITSTTRSAVLPALPTVAEAGVPGYEFSSWVGILAPASTPANIVSALNEYIVKAMRAPDLADRFSREGADVIASSPAQFGTYIGAELARWAKVVRESGMKAD
jgi:tripartite-type tricarboxylate transporter receptor subunit TctC